MGTDVRTLEDLVRCYYSGIKIVCIPDMESHDAASVIERYQKLRQEIHNAAKTTKKARKKAHLLMNSDELGVYFGYAFDHFSKHALGPFNFLAAAFHRQPVNATFKTHIIKAASCLLETRSFDTAAELFRTLSPLIASSILLEVCRKGYPQKSNVPFPTMHIRVWTQYFIRRFGGQNARRIRATIEHGIRTVLYGALAMQIYKRQEAVRQCCQQTPQRPSNGTRQHLCDGELCS
jgi:hypothetical protein